MTVQKLDFVNDTTTADVRYREGAPLSAEDRSAESLVAEAK